MLSYGDFGVSFRLVAGVAPVGLYFLILGLLNSRRHPQLLTGRQDSALLVAALGPVFVFPVVHYLGASMWTLAGVMGILIAAALLLGPRNASWVVYNLTVEQARRAVAQALDLAGQDARGQGKRFKLSGGGEVRLSGFGLLRNVSIRLHGRDRRTAREFEDALSQTLGRARVETTPMAVSLLLVATAMLVVPLTLVAHQAGDIVRILTDLLK